MSVMNVVCHAWYACTCAYMCIVSQVAGSNHSYGLSLTCLKCDYHIKEGTQSGNTCDAIILRESKSEREGEWGVSSLEESTVVS